MQWPPPIFFEHYNISTGIIKCRDQCHANLREVELFEKTTDLNNLPHSDSLKCYIHCGCLQLHLMKPNSTKVDIGEFLTLMADLSDEINLKYFRMSRGCHEKIRKLKDPVEVAYQLNVCYKRNAPDVSD